MGDDNSIHFASLKVLGDPIAQRPHSLDVHMRPWVGAPLFDLYVRHLFEPARRDEDVTTRQGGDRATYRGIVAH